MRTNSGGGGEEAITWGNEVLTRKTHLDLEPHHAAPEPPRELVRLSKRPMKQSA